MSEWILGEPQDLRAAAEDAYEWLVWIDKNLGEKIKEKDKLISCIESLHHHLSQSKDIEKALNICIKALTDIFEMKGSSEELKLAKLLASNGLINENVYDFVEVESVK